jgi:polar amino acid transport system substrate-binding protein
MTSVLVRLGVINSGRDYLYLGKWRVDFMSLKNHKSKIAIVAAALIGITTLVTGSGAANSAGGAQGTIDYAYFTKLGWTPKANSLPNLSCRDSSYSKAITSGINLGVYNNAPEMWQVNGKSTGIDFDMNVAVLHYIGVTKINEVLLQWPQMIPALLSKRIDVIAGDIHENQDRFKVIAFTTPAWWYSTTLMVKKDSTKSVKTWADLQKSGIKVGTIAGSYPQEALSKLTPKPDLTTFASDTEEFQALVSGKIDVAVHDSPVEAAFALANPSANLKILNPTTAATPEDFQDPYARFAVRPADCTLLGAYNRALQELRDHGIFTKILAKYGLDADALYEPAYRP